jgi:hypothetical protein
MMDISQGFEPPAGKNECQIIGRGHAIVPFPQDGAGPPVAVEAKKTGADIDPRKIAQACTQIGMRIHVDQVKRPVLARKFADDVERLIVIDNETAGDAVTALIEAALCLKERP